MRGRACILTPVAVWCAVLAVAAGAAAQETTVLVGSGSSVPAPLYARWAQEYNQHNSRIQFRYLPTATKEGIEQISKGSGDFGAGEVPLAPNERAQAGLTEIPVALVGIVPVYNLSGVKSGLRLSGEVLAGIFLGEIRNWNAAPIAKLNPDMALPNAGIQVVYRPAGKGSNYIFTDFLSKNSAKFKARVGTTPSPKWPVGEAAERSSDMADKVKREAGAIGYVELAYAMKSGLSQAAVLNPAGKFVKASAESITAACRDVEDPRWDKFSTSLTNAPGEDSFPIASFTWVYLRTDGADTSRTLAIQEFFAWVFGEGQNFAEQEGYPPLPAELVASVRGKMKEIR
ncbi:MAG TPA: phosphate ABC transporter substrate-binding protein PstS [Terriglobales bacterium]|nr:phosphate ABC transporter substrate-binding protein PstS [Terriglobales bacterium]